MATDTDKPVTWTANRGEKPLVPDHRRVRVVLRKDVETMGEPRYDPDPMVPPGWDVGRARWTLTGDRFDIMFYSVL